MLKPPSTSTRWNPFAPHAVNAMLHASPSRWWLSGGAALDRWIGRPIRPRTNIDVSVIATDLDALITSLAPEFSAWVTDEASAEFIAFDSAPVDADRQPVLIRHDESDNWAFQINVEDGTDRVWVYKRDPRLQLAWDAAVREIDGMPTGSPHVQLLWKSLRPRPEDEVDKSATLAELADDDRAWWERAVLSIHPHSTWSIQLRSPFAPAKASWTPRSSQPSPPS